ncbi:MAG: hypothetical protein HY904_13140 [Deltaproteobacteria bacterium]|nr:hypothetical protein [Deltaproteobacteria bacterium]
MDDVGIPWVVVMGFMRMTTHPGVLANPLTVRAASACIRPRERGSAVRFLDPGPRHLDLWLGLLETVGVAGSLTTDAHLAAVAIEHNALLCSADATMGRFPGLRWKNPLVA